MLASHYGHTEIVKYLIEAKASLDLQMEVYWILGWKIVNLTVEKESGDYILCWRFEKKMRIITVEKPVISLW